MPSIRQQHKLLKHPYIGAVFLFVWGSIFAGCSVIFDLNDSRTFREIASMVSALMLLGIHRLWFIEEYDGSFSKNSFKHKDVNITVVFVFVITVLVVMLPTWCLSGVNVPNGYMIIKSMSAGMLEEVLCRALMISIIMRASVEPKDVKGAVIFTALFFGLMHLTNLCAGADVRTTIIQTFSAAAAGVFFAAVFMRTGNIIFTMIFHSVYNLLSLMQNENGIVTPVMMTVETLAVIIHAFVLAFAGFFLVHKHTYEILLLWKNKWSKENKVSQNA